MFNAQPLTRAFALIVALVLGHTTLGQCLFVQPWTAPTHSFSSRVRSCDQPTNVDRIAMDDFVCREGGKLERLRWWGTVSGREQALRGSYYVAIYVDNGRCGPGELVYKACVKPRPRLAGFDCREAPVVQFDAIVPAFEIRPGARYWLQISEDDERSARPGAEDFRWSGHQPNVECEAIQIDTEGNIISPLIDPCSQRPSDLAFAFRAL